MAHDGGGGGSGPPDKFTYVDTSGLNKQQTVDALSTLFTQGFTGPYVVVGTTVYVGAYSENE